MNQQVSRPRSRSRSRWLVASGALLWGVMACGGAGGVAANEIGFVEQFALASDRSQALEQLIPGTEDFYFYSCLHAQHTQEYQEAERLLTEWIKRHGETARAKQIKTRQMLLRYDEHPNKTLDYLRRELNLHFDHQRDHTGDDPKLPTALDPKLISREVLLKRAIAAAKKYRRFHGICVRLAG